MQGTLKYAGILFKEKIFCKKTMILLALQIYMIFLYCKPLIAFSDDMSYPVMPLIFPFFISDIRFLFLFVLGMIYHFSDVPFMQYEGMYQIIRMGKMRWCIGQMLSVVLRAFGMLGINILACCFILVRHIEVGTGWGKLLHTAALTNVTEMYRFSFSLNYDTMNQFTPLQLTMLTWLVCGFVLSFLVLLMFVLSLFIGRGAAIAAAVVMDIVIFLAANSHPFIQQTVSKLIPVTWMQMANINSKHHDSFLLPPLFYILTFLTIGSILLAAASLWKIYRVEFRWVKEES